jgi:cell division protein FtsB
MSQYDFSSLEVIEQPVHGPNKQWYLLREASADAVAKYNSARSRTVKIEDGEVVGVQGAGELEPLLVSYCLYHAEVVKDDEGIVVEGPDGVPELQLATDSKGRPRLENLSVIQSWPGRVVTALHNLAKQISEIDLDDNLESLYKQRRKLDKQIKKMEKDAAKNELSGTPTGSDMPNPSDTPDH